jgi:hypothetical protein
MQLFANDMFSFEGTDSTSLAVAHQDIWVLLAVELSVCVLAVSDMLSDTEVED